MNLLLLCARGFGRRHPARAGSLIVLLSMALLAPVGVPTGNNVMIGGFIVGGSTNLTLVAVRAPTRPEEAAVRR